MPIPEDLKRDLAAGRVVPFVGAGVSMNVRGPHGAYGGEQKRLFPSWTELLEAARARMQHRDPDSAALLDVSSALKKGDLLTAADSAIDALGDGWPKLVEQALDPSLEDATGLELARAVWTLGSRLVVTTNYDRVLGFTSGDLRAGRWVVSSPGGMARYLAQPKVGRPIVWHLHGHVDDPTRMVLGNASYARLYDEATGGQRPDWRAAIATLRSLFTGHVVLFIGFSMADAYVRAVLAGVLTTFDGAAPSPYILCHRAQADALRNLGRDSGITLNPVAVDGFGAPMVDALREMGRIAGGQSSRQPLPYTLASPPPTPAAPLPAGWSAAVQAHRLFAQVGDGLWRDRLLATVERCAKARADARVCTLARIGAEPWSDDGFTGRVLARLGELIPDAEVSPPEAALLLAAPCLAEAVRALAFAALAERADLLRLAPVAGERRRMRQLLENAHQAHPALLRRVERLGDDVRVPIATWLGWRALDRATHL